MNRLNGKIEEIQVSGHLSQVTVSLAGGHLVQAVVIETPETAAYLSMGGQIGVLFKETEVILSLGEGCLTSLENKLPARVEHLEAGALLSRVVLHCAAGPLTAVIATRAAKRLALMQGQEVHALIPSSEIMLTEP
jgi:molybdopterin-binding protein